MQTLIILNIFKLKLKANEMKLFTNRITGRTLILILVAATGLSAQYSLEWQVNQDASEKGIIYFDLNEDGTKDLAKIWLNNVAFFDGDNAYQPSWEITDSNYDYLNIYEIYELENYGVRYAILISTSYDPIYRCKVAAWTIFGSEPAWETPELQGTVYFLDSNDIDEDGVEEIIMGLNDFNYETSTYTSKILIYNALDGALEWESDLFDGYIAGPYVGNMDADPQKEILYNLYDYESEVYTLNVLQFDGTVAVDETTAISNSLSLGRNYPNPFNPTTQIPITIESKSNVTVKIYNSTGQEVITLCDKSLDRGNYTFRWFGHNQHGKPMPSGVYHCRIETETASYSRPMVLLK